MNDKEKIIKELKGIYSSDLIGPNAVKSPGYEALEKLLAYDDIKIFFDLWEKNDPVLRAWAWEGINTLIMDKKAEDIKDLEILTKIQQIVLGILKDNSIIETLLGCKLSHQKVNEVFVGRICYHDHSIILNPLMEFVKTEETNIIVGSVFEYSFYKIPDPEVEELLFKHAMNAKASDFETKKHLIEAINRMNYESYQFKKKDELKIIFKKYLKEINEDKTEAQETIQRDKSFIHDYKIDIQARIIELAAALDLGFEKETFDFIKSLEHRGSHILPIIAEKFSKNEEFLQLILEKLNQTKDSSLVSDIFRALVKLGHTEWKKLIKDYILKHKLIDSTLLRDLEEKDMIDEEIITICLIDGHLGQKWYVSQYLEKHPEKIDEWPKLRAEFIKILNTPKWYSEDFEKKKAVLNSIEKMKRTDMINEVMKNLRIAENKNIKVYAAKAIGEIGGKEQLEELKELLEIEKDIAEYSMFGENEILNAINKIKSRINN